MQRTDVLSLFAPPRDAVEAARQARILERAQSLFTSGCYSWYLSATSPFLFGVCGPKGQHYVVDMRANTCTCKSSAKDGDCKHRLAIALSQECADTSLCQQAEQAQETFDCCLSDRYDREVRETGFLCY